MCKLLLVPVFVALCFADFSAFSATARNSRGMTNTANNNAVAAPVAARAAVRGTTKTTTNAAPVAARAATRNAPKATNVTTTTKPAGGAVAARAGAKQKVINMGTKISSATANTIVNQECQDAYFGCMDSFCMLENTTGGRCKCSDKNAEYDDMLVEIQKLDQQSYVMQTEGVSLLKMGKSADEVYAMAQSAADKVTGVKKEANTNGSSVDLSAWNKDWFEDDDLFEEEDMSSPLDSDLTSKTGDKLHASAARICTQQIPTQCKASVSMLRMVYVQKIQSDCAAYSNSLKQQQLESTQKLQTARQSLRDTALEKYQESNKYDLGGCVREYNTCMQKEDTCGEGFTSCVTLSATDNLQSNKSGKVAKQTSIKSMYSSITLSASTMDQLLSKRVFCESILEQCVNVKDQVWDAFLKSAAPTIKTAESDIESNLRINCVKEVSECFQTGCKEQMDPNNPDGSYDMCLSNPNLYKSLCKPKLEPCLLATGGTYDNPDASSLWTALLSRLASMKVDACTKEVKDCLLSDDRCGKDYAGCIGLSTYDIGNLCPAEKLTACRDDRKGLSGDALEADIREYVANVAQGLALNIDNSMLTHCQTALKTAMLTFCGAEDTCPNAAVDENMFKDIMSVQLCKRENNKLECKTDPYGFSDQDLIDGKVVPTLMNKVDLSAIQYQLDNASSSARSNADGGTWNQSTFKSIAEAGVDPFAKVGVSSNSLFNLKNLVSTYTKPDDTYDDNALDRVIRTLNSNFKTLANSIESDPKVVYCTSGRKVQGFSTEDEKKFIGANSSRADARFPSLTQNARAVIAQQLLIATSPVYYDTQQRVVDEQMATMTKALSDRVGEIVTMTQEKQHLINESACSKLARSGSKPSCHGCQYNEYRHVPTYNRDTWTCDVEFTHWHRKYCGCADKFKEDIEHKLFAMPRLTKEDIRNAEDISKAVKDEKYIQDELGIKDKGKDISNY